MEQSAARWAVSLDAAQLPAPVVAQVKRCVMDGLGVTIAGTRTRTASIAASFAEETSRTGPATVPASGASLTVPAAILANATASNAWDMDDGFRPSKGHPGGFVVMPALAAAQERGADRLLSAIAVGYEIACRAAIATHRYYTHYHASGSWGSLGTAACVGHMLGLNAERMGWALGLSEYHAALAPIERCLATPAMTKDAIGWGAYAGACAAYLAARDFTGNASLFEDTANADLVDDLGTKWHILDLYFKPYACCRWAQPGVDALFGLMDKHGCTYKDLRCIRIHTFREATLLQQSAPRSSEEAQYHLFWPLAAALLHGTVGPGQVADESLRNTEMIRLIDCMQAEVDPAIQARFPAEALSWLEVELEDGQSYRSPPTPARGDAGAPLTTEELEEKFRVLVGPVLGTRTESLLEMLRRLEEPGAAEELLGSLSQAGKHLAGT